jgi:hypothetical protein
MMPRSGGAIEDVEITDNVFGRTSGGIQLVGVDDVSTSLTPLMKRIKIHNNVLAGINHWEYRSIPLSASPGMCGYAISAPYGVEDLTITNNTAVGSRGPSPNFFHYGTLPGEGVTVKFNLLSHSHDFNYGALMPAPNSTTTVKQTWDRWFTNSDFSDNVVIPEVRVSSTSQNYDSGAAALTFSVPSCRSYYLGFPRITCVGTGAAGETANNRRSQAGSFDHNTGVFRYSGAYGPVGADYSILENTIGKRLEEALASTPTTGPVQVK